METHVPRCPATHGIPFIVGTGPPEITVGTPSPYGSYPELPPAGSATAVGDVAIAAAHTPARINWRMLKAPGHPDDGTARVPACMNLVEHAGHILDVDIVRYRRKMLRAQ